MKKIFYTILVFLFFVVTANAVTYYGDSANVAVSGTTSNYQVTLSNVSLNAGTTYRLTVYAKDTEDNYSTTYIDFTTASSGSATVSITSPTNGTLYTSPDSRTRTISGTYTGTPSTMTYSCPNCTVTSGSVTFSEGTWSKEVELGTDGLGANKVTSSEFSSTSGWDTTGGWTINTGAGVISDTGSTSIYGYNQNVSITNYSWQRTCINVTVSDSGLPYLSQWSFLGEGYGAAFGSGTGEHCLDKMVRNQTANLFIVGNPAFTGSITSTTVQEIGKFNAFTVTVDGAVNDTIYLTHYTASQGTQTTVTQQWPYYSTLVAVDSTVQMRIANDDTAPTSGSIAVNLAITGQAGIDYDCNDTGIVVCTSYSGEEGDGYDVAITPTDPFLYGKEYTVTVSADNLASTGWTFKTRPPFTIFQLGGM